MNEASQTWKDKCKAAREIRERFGTEKAAGCLIGEKLLEFLRVSDRRPEVACELPNFVAEIKAIFSPAEIRVYLDNLKRVGDPGHVLADDKYEVMRNAGAFDDDVVRGAEDVILVGRIRELLLG